MNKRFKINKAIREYCSPRFRLDKNSVRINVHNKLPHEIGKLTKSYELISEGYEVYTEVVFKNGCRADIFVPEKLAVYEILNSETEKEALEKTENYPEGLEIFTIKAEDLIKELYVS